jgi:hypothetical protein
MKIHHIIKKLLWGRRNRHRNSHLKFSFCLRRRMDRSNAYSNGSLELLLFPLTYIFMIADFIFICPSVTHTRKNRQSTTSEVIQK